MDQPAHILRDCSRDGVDERLHTTHLTRRAGRRFNYVFTRTYAAPPLPSSACTALALIAEEPVLQRLLGGLARHSADRGSQRDPLRGAADAIRSLSAAPDPPPA